MPNPKAASIKIVVADQHGAVRQGIISVLHKQRGLRVVGQAENGREAVRLVKQLKPHVVILDIPMALLNGMAAARQIMSQCPRTNVLLLSAVQDDYHMDQALQIGVRGYLAKSSDIHMLSKAVRGVAAGHTAFSKLMEQYTKAHPVVRKLAAGGALSVREMEVLQLIGENFSTKLIAAELGVSKKTVEKYRGTLMDKLNRHTIASLVNYAISTGICQAK